MSPEVLDLFMSYNWPGNVRELKNTLTYAWCCMENAGESELGASYLPERLLNELAAESWVNVDEAPPPVPATSLRMLAAETERNGIVAALDKAGYNKSKAARALGISRNTLYLKMKTYGIPIEG